MHEGSNVNPASALHRHEVAIAVDCIVWLDEVHLPKKVPPRDAPHLPKVVLPVLHHKFSDLVRSLLPSPIQHVPHPLNGPLYIMLVAAEEAVSRPRTSRGWSSTPSGGLLSVAAESLSPLQPRPCSSAAPQSVPAAPSSC
eukprot:CAMPEP_0114114970 /NCGR_PEP_ID=MMETSP0043_2-20121206/3721_1 /TAXON_ID=464988 /ORGANISM="Hemiselmis andersenii, Strain CCMP644" /LENGTH=139 /DNA_ID=CAMNT_0001207205 /DNA_START=272 /DNA_END=691 /DNA_ORIENTATION=-